MATSFATSNVRPVDPEDLQTLCRNLFDDLQLAASGSACTGCDICVVASAECECRLLSGNRIVRLLATLILSSTLAMQRFIPVTRRLFVAGAVAVTSPSLLPLTLSVLLPLRSPTHTHHRRSFGVDPRQRRTPILPSPLVDVDWLHANLHRVKVLDGSWFMPGEKRDTKADFIQRRIQGAQYFDIDAVRDHSNPMPHMLPSPTQFADAVGRLGVRDDDAVVVYDTKGLFSAARVWFTFRCFGASDVAVLDGGLPLWVNRLYPMESGPVQPPEPVQFIPRDRTRQLVRTYNEMLANSRKPAFQVLDARSIGRFDGSNPEPRPNLSSGHMPHSLNTPYSSLIRTDKDGHEMMKTLEGLELALRHAGVKLDEAGRERLVATCGTGVTASVIALALELLGQRNWSVYDGSWTEWASKQGSPIEKSAAAELQQKKQ